MRPVELVIFDCDGVLVDSERIANREWAALLGELGLAFTVEQSIATFVGHTMTRCVEIVAERLGRRPPADLLERYHARIAEALPREVTPVPGVVELLDALDAAGVPYAVASNGEHRKMRVTLGATGLLARFEGRRFSAADVARPKPAPDLFLHAAATLGAQPARTLVVEDSPLGVQGARAAGMRVVGYADLMPAERLLEAGAERVVRDVRDVRDLLGARCRRPDVAGACGGRPRAAGQA
jgi:HAD superfamily hydrolase (TIGR01509 family)